MAVAFGLWLGSSIAKATRSNANPLSLITSAYAKECSRYCNPAKSKPCGRGCISKSLNCRKSWTTACVGIRENVKPKGTKPKHTEMAPDQG